MQGEYQKREGEIMADINDLEARLQQCKKVLSSVLDNMDYIEREIKIAKETDKSVENTSSVSSADSFPSRGSQNIPIYQAGVHVNQGSFNSNANKGPVNQGPVNQGPVNQGLVNQGQVNHGPVNFTQPQGNVNQNVRPQVGPQVPPQAKPQGNMFYGNPQINPQGYTNRGPVNQRPINQGPINQGPINHGPINQGSVNQGPNYGPVNQGPVNQANPNQPKKALSIEAIFGKNIMAIAASILIFISLILFATLILPKLTKEVKFFMTYLCAF